jgi:microcin C transport system substrate-binding protein
VLPFVRNLKRLGIEARVRVVDQSQYINRLRSFDYDLIVAGWPESESPGNEQRESWTRKAADSPAANNYAGIKDPVVDELVELVINAPDRESLVARTRALDRVLMFGYYVIPQWHVRVQRILHWDKFSRPALTPKTGTSIAYWWFDPEKDARLEQARAAQPPSGQRNARATPGLGIALVAIAGVGLIGFFVFRRVWRRTGTL